MNATELKTYRQSLWLTREAAARLFNVQDRVYRYWESGDWPIPADVEATMHDIDRALTDMADHACDGYAEQVNRLGVPPAQVVLIRYSSDEDLWHFNPQMPQLTHTLHAAGIDRTRQRLEWEGATVRIVTMDRNDLEAWSVRQRPGLPVSLEAWAATATDPPTRAKKTGMASGENSA